MVTVEVTPGTIEDATTGDELETLAPEILAGFHQPETSSWRHPALLAAKVIITVLCVSFNLLGTVVILRARLYRKCMYVTVLLMTITDLVMGLVHLPFALWLSVVGHEAEKTWACAAFEFSMNVFIESSLLCLVIYNVERYVAIRWPYIYINKVAGWKVVSVWGVLMAAVCVWKATLTAIADLHLYTPKYEVCISVTSLTKYRPAVVGWVFNVVCYLVIVVTTLLVVIISCRHGRQIHRQDLVSGKEINRADASALAGFQAVGLMTAVFFITALPKFVLLFHPNLPEPTPVVCMWLVYCNGFVNVLVCGYKLRGFRDELCKMVPWLPRMRSKVEAESSTALYAPNPQIESEAAATCPLTGSTVAPDVSPEPLRIDPPCHRGQGYINYAHVCPRQPEIESQKSVTGQGRVDIDFDVSIPTTVV